MTPPIEIIINFKETLVLCALTISIQNTKKHKICKNIQRIQDFQTNIRSYIITHKYTFSFKYATSYYHLIRNSCRLSITLNI